MVSDRAFIFHICIPCGETNFFVCRSGSTAKVQLDYQGSCFTKKKKVITLAITFELYVIELSYFTFNVNFQC